MLVNGSRHLLLLLFVQATIETGGGHLSKLCPGDTAANSAENPSNQGSRRPGKSETNCRPGGRTAPPDKPTTNNRALSRDKFSF